MGSRFTEKKQKYNLDEASSDSGSANLSSSVDSEISESPTNKDTSAAMPHFSTDVIEDEMSVARRVREIQRELELNTKALERVRAVKRAAKRAARLEQERMRLEKEPKSKLRKLRAFKDQLHQMELETELREVGGSETDEIEEESKTGAGFVKKDATSGSSNGDDVDAESDRILQRVLERNGNRTPIQGRSKGTISLGLKSMKVARMTGKDAELNTGRKLKSTKTGSSSSRKISKVSYSTTMTLKGLGGQNTTGDNE